jgi:hypothetical protein
MAFTPVTTQSIGGLMDPPAPVAAVDLGPVHTARKNAWPDPDFDSMSRYYGRIELSKDDIVAERWVNQRITRVAMPWRCYLLSKDLDVRLERIPLNTEVVPSFNRICARILREIGENGIDANGLNLICETAAYRVDTNRGIISPFAWGAAVRFDVIRNPYKSEKPKTRGHNLDDRVIEAFEEEGWHWGGRNKFHFEPSLFTATSR